MIRSPDRKPTNKSGMKFFLSLWRYVRQWLLKISQIPYTINPVKLKIISFNKKVPEKMEVSQNKGRRKFMFVFARLFVTWIWITIELISLFDIEIDYAME